MGQNKKQSSGQFILLQHLQRNSQMKSMLLHQQKMKRYSKIISIIYYFSTSTSLPLWNPFSSGMNPEFSTASYSKIKQPKTGKTQQSELNCKRILQSTNVPSHLSPVEFDYQHIQSIGTRGDDNTRDLQHCGYSMSYVGTAVSWGPPNPKPPDF